MSNVPTYQAATVGQPGNAGHSNQFQVPHNGSTIYTGSQLTDSETTGSGIYIETYDQYVSQQFSTSSTQTAISQVWLQLSAINGSAITNNIDPFVVSIYADYGGFPTGSALATSSLTETVIYGSAFWSVFLIPLTGLTPSTNYHIVTSPVGDPNAGYYVLQQNNLTGGVLTSPDNADWTIQTYGIMFQVYDQTPSGLIQYLVEDDGARWTQFTYTGNRITGVTEYTIDQTGTGSFQSTRTLTYSAGTGDLITGIN